MYEVRALPVYSPEFTELQAIFYKLERPYGFNEILHFNQAYERIYWSLRKEEKRYAERFIDALIDDLKTPELACKIFGVV
ncbi:hypothetical protein RP726_19485 [Candidatus Methylospira mobilis]|uniref:hypothetical protein n=1 Tax=Candidatus Methylospira mobilis TaxID=1808979 RepID=UPI0028E27055|nr:hypothetical protein [Candidatus Methylospira mobilis]WNV04553.1 hypothetical protein RP726_19485 [Candidatus Methylospira mobilis]